MGRKQRSGGKRGDRRQGGSRASRKVSPELKRTLGELLAAAGAGRADLGWLDKAIRKAGYLPAAEAVTEKDVEVALARVRRIMETVATPAEPITGREWRKRVEKAFAEVETGS